VSTRDNIRSYAHREWSALEELKRAHWAERFRVEGPDATWNAGQALRKWAEAQLPGWPAPAAREEDLATHIRVKALLDRAAHAVARR
jgi:hypothetical protein